MNHPLTLPPKTVTVTHKCPKREKAVVEPKKFSPDTVARPIGAKPYLAELPPNPFCAKSKPPTPKESILKMRSVFPWKSESGVGKGQKSPGVLD